MIQITERDGCTTDIHLGLGGTDEANDAMPCIVSVQLPGGAAETAAAGRSAPAAGEEPPEEPAGREGAMWGDD